MMSILNLIKLFSLIKLNLIRLYKYQMIKNRKYLPRCFLKNTILMDLEKEVV